MNRSRLRRMLCHLVLDWDSLQVDVSTSGFEFYPAEHRAGRDL